MRHISNPQSNTAPVPVADGRKTNAASTQAALRRAGRKLFGELGYEATSLGAICAEAGVTTGALYHHFGDKKGLFAAVAEELDESLVQLTAAARNAALRSGADAWQAFMAAIDAFLQAGLSPEGRRIGLTDAPAVLGAQGWLEIRERHGLGAMVQTVRTLQSLGLMPAGDVVLRARLVLGLLYGAVEALAHQHENAAQPALTETRALVQAMLNGMRSES
nr:TetR/AcrR family transcriptional regulator [uncultured Rhodoferax sp.]